MYFSTLPEQYQLNALCSAHGLGITKGVSKQWRQNWKDKGRESLIIRAVLEQLSSNRIKLEACSLDLLYSFRYNFFKYS